MKSERDTYRQFNKVVVVGASRGVGAAIAEYMRFRTSELITIFSNASDRLRSNLKNSFHI